MKMNSSAQALIIGLLLLVSFVNVSFAADNSESDEQMNEADVLDGIVLHSFEHFDFLDILFKLKGHNNYTWVVLFYVDGDHHKTYRDDIKRLIFGQLSEEEQDSYRYAEANISRPNYSPISQAIRFPQHLTADSFPMILIMKNEVGQMIYGRGAARLAADIIEQKKAEEAEAQGDQD